MARSTQVTCVGLLWWKNAKTFEPTRIGTCPSPPVPWPIAGSGRGIASDTSPSSASLPALACSVRAPAVAGSAVQPRAVRTDDGLSACAPSSSAVTAGSGSAASASSVTPAGAGATAAPQLAPWPSTRAALPAAAGAPPTLTP